MRSHLAAWCLGLAVSLLVSFAGAGADDTVSLRRAEGAAVRFHAKLPWKPVDAGPVKIGATLRCTDACELGLSLGGAVSIAGEATLGLEPPRFAKVGDAVARKVDALRIDAGRATVAHGGDAPILIVAGGSEIVLRSGQLEVVAGETRVAVAVGDATAARRDGRDWHALPAGRIVALEGAQVTDRPLPGAPTWRTSQGAHQPLGLAADRPEGAVRLAWSPGAQAQSIRVEIAEDAAFSRIVHRDTVAAGTGSVAVSLREGAYHARLAATDRDGFASAPGPAMPLRVVRVALPDGGLIPEPGTVVLPAGSALRLLSIDGLEMSLGGRGFVPAARDIPMADTRGQLRLRVRGVAASESAFTLEPRALRAAIEMTPFAPIWPRDTVEVKVELRDPRGHHDLDRIAPRLRVHLENEEILVTWQKQGSVHRARIHGRRIDGPRLLRVQVEDAAGRSLGESLVEVVASR